MGYVGPNKSSNICNYTLKLESIEKGNAVLQYLVVTSFAPFDPSIVMLVDSHVEAYSMYELVGYHVVELNIVHVVELNIAHVIELNIAHVAELGYCFLLLGSMVHAEGIRVGRGDG